MKNETHLCRLAFYFKYDFVLYNLMQIITYNPYKYGYDLFLRIGPFISIILVPIPLKIWL